MAYLLGVLNVLTLAAAQWLIHIPGFATSVHEISGFDSVK
jgi:hypothetical protein